MLILIYDAAVAAVVVVGGGKLCNGAPGSIGTAIRTSHEYEYVEWQPDLYRRHAGCLLWLLSLLFFVLNRVAVCDPFISIDTTQPAATNTKQPRISPTYRSRNCGSTEGSLTTNQSSSSSGEDGEAPATSSSLSFMGWYEHATMDIVEMKSSMRVATIIGFVAIDFI